MASDDVKTPCMESEPSVFFPEGEKLALYAEGKKLCRECPYAAWWDCLLTGEDETHGLRGSLSPRERRKFFRQGFAHAR